MFNPSEFPEFIMNMPEADVPIENLDVRLLSGKNGSVVLITAIETVEVPMHSHGPQWGMCIDGTMELTLGDETRTLSKGESYNIPAGLEHGAILHKGMRVLDFFEDPDRYEEKK